MWKTPVLVGLTLLSAPALAAADAGTPAAPGPVLRLCPEARHAALAELGLRFPQRLSLASFTTTVRDAPGADGKVLRRLPRGSEVEALGWVQGSEARNTCDASPYDGCIGLSDAWVEVALPGKGERRGFLSAINVTAPAALSCPTVPFMQLVDLRAFDVKNDPAPDPGRTLFDKVGLDHFLAVPVQGGEVTLNRRQLELLVRRQPRGRLQYVPSEKQTPHPELQPLMADVELQPALPAFAVQGDQLVRMDLGRLEVVEPLLTWGEEEHYSPSTPPELRGEDDIPHLREVRFRVPSAPEGLEVLILTTPEGAKALGRGRAKVSRKQLVRGKKERQQDVITRAMVLVDLDGNGASELVREQRTVDPAMEEEEGEERTLVRVGYGGEWYELAWAPWARHGL